MDQEILVLAEKIVSLGAESVFIYGSRARDDNLPDSDWELGAILGDDKYLSRSELAKLAPDKVVIYPYLFLEIKAGVAQTPFTNSIWLTEIIKTGKTIAGEHLLESLRLPTITKEDINDDSVFHKARALDAMLAQRNGAEELAKDIFVKSCLLGMRDLILASGGDFPLSYLEIVEKSKPLLPEKYKGLPLEALQVRKGEVELTAELAYKNIGFFTDVLELGVK
ncbi:MAG: hypothetical protein AAB896_03205 [Patescibacteria group bacterium]